MCISVLNKHDHDTSTEAARRRVSSAGRITPGVELIVADDEGRPLPTGATGEIWLRTRATISGYYRNPEGTAAEFTNGFWKSGDLGYVDDGGYLFIVDRKKDMIITGGFNVYAVEVDCGVVGASRGDDVCGRRRAPRRLGRGRARRGHSAPGHNDFHRPTDRPRQGTARRVQGAQDDQIR
jgi:acyl-CoA synthetase (AMP-forming)/AMP-acid ligase II